MMDKFELLFDLYCFDGASRKEKRRGAFWATLNILKSFAKRSDIKLRVIDSSSRNFYEIREILKEFNLSQYLYDYSKTSFLLTYPRYKTKNTIGLKRHFWKLLDSIARRIVVGLSIRGSSSLPVCYFTTGKFKPISAHKKCVRCAYVWDMIPFVVPHLIEKGRHVYLNEIIHNPDQFDIYFTDSESAKTDLSRVANIDVSRIHVAYLGSSEQSSSEIVNDYEVLSRYGLRKDSYAFCVSAYEIRKNFERLIEAFICGARRAKRDVKLLIIGSGQDKLKESLRLLCCSGKLLEEDLDRYILLLGYVPSKDMDVIERNALFVAYVSLYEGFGLPVLDAMKKGIPVLTSNVSSLPEVAGDAGLMVDPYSTEDIARGVFNLLESAQLRESLKNRGIVRARLFSWENCTDSVVQKVESYLMKERVE